MIYIITPSSRPTFLPQIQEAVTREGVCWRLMLDGEFYKKVPKGLPGMRINKPEGSILGNHLKNVALEVIKDGWVYVLDDDNQIHPDFFDEIERAIAENPGKSVISFNQQIDPVSIRRGNEYQVGKIDQAQYIIKREFIGDLRYEQSYQSDGVFIETLYQKDPGAFLYIDKVLSYYNHFRKR